MRPLFLLSFVLLLAACSSPQVSSDPTNPHGFVHNLAAGGWSGRKIINPSTPGTVEQLVTDSSGAAIATGKLILKGEPSPFIVKYSSSGTLVWTKDLSYTGQVALDSSGNIYLVSSNWYDLAPLNPDCPLVNGNQSNYQLLSKLDANGNLLWKKSLCYGSSQKYPVAISVGSSGVHIGLKGEIDGSALPCGQTVQNQYSYILGFSSTGSQLYCKAAPSESHVSSLEADSSGNVYATYDYDPSTQLGSRTLELEKFNSSGQTLWGKRGTDFAYSGYNLRLAGVADAVYLTLQSSLSANLAMLKTDFNGNSLALGPYGYAECSDPTRNHHFVGPQNRLYAYSVNPFAPDPGNPYYVVATCDSQGVVTQIKRWYRVDLTINTATSNRVDSIFVGGSTSQVYGSAEQYPFLQKLNPDLSE